MSKPTFPTTTLPNYIEEDVVGFRALIDDVKTNGVVEFKHGRSHRLAGEDYDVTPVRIITKTAIYEFKVPLEIDALIMDDEGMMNMVGEWIEDELAVCEELEGKED